MERPAAAGRHRAVVLAHGGEGDLPVLEHLRGLPRRGGRPGRRWPASPGRARTPAARAPRPAGCAAACGRATRASAPSARSAPSRPPRTPPPRASRAGRGRAGAVRGRRTTRRPGGVPGRAATPGSPRVRTELPRLEKPPEARSSHVAERLPPRPAASPGGPAGRPPRRRGGAAGEGRGGTVLPETMSPVGIVTRSPRSRRTATTESVHDSQIPSTSVIAGPPEGPRSPGTRRRTTTLRPTTCGPRESPTTVGY